MKRFAQYLYAAGMAGLGFLSLRFADFALNWQPVPDGIPLRTPLAYISGTILLLGGIGLTLRATALRSAAVLAGFVFLWLLVLQLPRVAPRPGDVGAWLGFCENLLLFSGSWLLFVFQSQRQGKARSGFLATEAGLRYGRVCLALSLPLIGVSHFVFVGATASMVPAWLPARTFIAYLTGTGHILAGIAMLIRIWPRLAATLEAVMLSLFVLLLHIPGVAADPSSRFQWTMLFVASALTASAWAGAAAWSSESWLTLRSRQ